MNNLSVNKKESIYQFDVLRGLAIIAVFLVHSQYAIYPDFDFSYGAFSIIIPGESQMHKYLAMSPFAFGWSGVTLFFIVSGFLIHYGTLQSNREKVDWLLFFNKRFWRIYPPYFLALSFFYFSQNSLGNFLHNPLDYFSHLFLLHTFKENYFFSINGVFWSLAIELHLYMLYPLFLSILRRIGMRRTLLVLLIVHVVCTIVWYIFFNFKSLVVANLVIRHWLTWALGAWLAENYYYKKAFLSKLPNLLILSVFIFFYFSKLFFFHFATDSLLSSVLIAVGVEKYLNRKSVEITKIEKLLVPIGLCSYSLYLFHMPFLKSIFDSVDIFGLNYHTSIMFLIVNLIPVFTILFLVSFGSYLFIEQKSIQQGYLFAKRFLKLK